MGFEFNSGGADDSLLRVTVFADDLNYPVGMTELADGSLLVAVTNGSSYFGGTSGSLMRLADEDGDGVADVRQTLVSDVPHGKVTAVERVDDLVVVTGQGAGAPITIYRTGAAVDDPFTAIGSFTLTYP
ncbi:MAG: hypothetical protein KDA61_09535, partial [Planctomycetales bacterium]|nr:hypothetical protein [Planctomycetales bacterium]